MARNTIDEIDRKIVALLQENGRVTNMEIARQLGIVEGTVRKRLERLLDEGHLTITALPKPSAFGYRVHAIIAVQTDLTHTTEVAATLSAMPEVVSVYLTSGGCDLVVEVLLPSNEQLLSFLAGRLAAIPGVRRTETNHVLRAFKQVSDWRIPEVAMAKPPKVLVVDDDLGFVKIVSAILSSTGYEVVSANNGDEALKRAKEGRPDLIMLDYMMDSLTEGSTVAYLLREDEELRDIPILMVSAVGTKHPWWKVQPDPDALPVDGWLDKPVEADSLLNEVTRLLLKP